MIQLPSNATVAALGMFIGGVIGAGATYWWMDTGQVPAHFSDYDGRHVVERTRTIQEEDTSGQRAPDVEIRYLWGKDVTLDSLRIVVPQRLTDGVVSDRTPIEVTPGRATWTYYDPKDRRMEQRVWQVPEDRYRLGLYAVGTRRWRVEPHITAGLGVEAHLDPQWLPGALEPFGEVRSGGQRLIYSTGIKWQIVQL